MNILNILYDYFAFWVVIEVVGFEDIVVVEGC